MMLESLSWLIGDTAFVELHGFQLVGVVGLVDGGDLVVASPHVAGLATHLGTQCVERTFQTSRNTCKTE